MEFDEYNENTKKLDEKYMIGNISTILVKTNISSFVINDEIVAPRRHHLDNGDLVIDNHIISHSPSSSFSSSAPTSPSSSLNTSAPSGAAINATNTLLVQQSAANYVLDSVPANVSTAPAAGDKQGVRNTNSSNLRGTEALVTSHHDPVSIVPVPTFVLEPPPPPPRTITHQNSVVSNARQSISSGHVFHELWGMGHNKTHIGQHHRHHKGAGYEPYIPTSGKKYSTTEPKAHASHDSYEKHIHQSLKDIDSGACKIVFIGDSVLSQMNRDNSIRKRLASYHPINLASPGFRTEHMLFRLTTSTHVHRVFEAPLFIVMMGTFNIGIHDTPDATKEGIMTIVGNIVKFSNHNSSRVVVCSILPRHSVSLNKEIDQTNTLLASAIKGMDRIHFLNLDSLFKGNPYPKKMLNDEFFMPDHLHPSENGYNAIIGALRSFLVPFGNGAFETSMDNGKQTSTDDEGIKKSDKVIYGVSNTGERDVRFTQAEAAKLAAEAVARALRPSSTQIKPEDVISAARKRNSAKAETGKVIKEKLKPLDKKLQEIQRVESTTASIIQSSTEKPRVYSASPTGDSLQSVPALPSSNRTTTEAILKEFQEFLRAKNMLGK